MTEFTEEKLAELRAVAEAATQSSWDIENDSEEDYEAGIAYAEWPSVLVGPENAIPSQWARDHGDTDRVQEIPELKPEDAEHIATFDPPTVLALIAALEAKTTEVEGYKQHYPCDGGCNYTDGPLEECSLHGRNPRELWEAIGGLTRERDEAEAALERVRAARAGHPECDKYDDDSPVSCGWKRTVQRIDAVLEALERADDE